MAKLSPNKLRAIRAYTLTKGLENFRLTFISEHLTGKNANVTEAIDRLISKASDRAVREGGPHFSIYAMVRPILGARHSLWCTPFSAHAIFLGIGQQVANQ